LSHFWGYVTALKLAAMSNTMHKILPCNWQKILCYQLSGRIYRHMHIPLNYSCWLYILYFKLTGDNQKGFCGQRGPQIISQGKIFHFFQSPPIVETSIIPCAEVIYMLAACSKGPKHQWKLQNLSSTINNIGNLSLPLWSLPLFLPPHPQ
jgi:hypothetical protein